jgi:GT2 family glycosyltransferase
MEYDSALTLSVAIPTYRRGGSLVNTISQVLALEHGPDQILVLDQTERHTEETASKLGVLHNRGDIVWQRLDKPSIPRAMNIALTKADSDIVLFLDDDIEITSEIVREHLEGHKKSNAPVVVGKIMQPWHGNLGDLQNNKNCTFTTDNPEYVISAMAGNMSVNRKEAIEVGGFDENFVRVAYRFEDDFAQRILQEDGKIYYQPTASILHIKLSEGGTRAFGHHLTTIRPYHSVGAYYFFLRSPGVKHRMWNVLKRLINASVTKHHLHKPWWIPITVISEISGIAWAVYLCLKGPSYINK